MEEGVEVIKPFKGIFYEKSQPLIRPLGKPTVTMMPLDLAANDYLAAKIRLADTVQVNENGANPSISLSILRQSQNEESMFERTQILSNCEFIQSRRSDNREEMKV